MNTSNAPTVKLVEGGYYVTIGQRVHFVDKSRRCSCGQAKCPAIKVVANYLRAGGARAPETKAPKAKTASKPRCLCPICGAEANGSIETRNWACSADANHFWTWWAGKIRAAREEALRVAPPEIQALHRFFESPERDTFLQAHRLTYPAQA